MNTQPTTESTSDTKVPLATKIIWGFGGLADNFMQNTLMTLGSFVYVVHFGLSPLLQTISTTV